MLTLVRECAQCQIDSARVGGLCDPCADRRLRQATGVEYARYFVRKVGESFLVVHADVATMDLVVGSFPTEDHARRFAGLMNGGVKR